LVWRDKKKIIVRDPLHRYEFGPPKFFSKTFKFSIRFTQLGKSRGQAKDEKHADPGKKNRNSRKSREKSRNLLEAFLRSRVCTLWCEQCPKHSFNRPYTLKGLLVLVEKLRFQKNFGRNFIAVEGVIYISWHLHQPGFNPLARTSGASEDFYSLNWDDITQKTNICIIYQCNSGHFTTSENGRNRRNTTKLMFPSLCSLKSRGEDFKNGFRIFCFSWILLVPKHSLLKYFTLTRHRSSKFEGSGPPLRVDLHPTKRNARDLRFETWWSIFWPSF